jgi:tetratricopeptide (TPR) repeat protein
MTLAEEREGLEQHLLTLQQEEMVRERARMPELEYIFKHELTREAAYQTLLKKERRAMHRHVAEALEHLFPQRIEEHLGLLAYHWEQSGDLERATGYLLRAGDKARLAYAHQESIEYYQRAQTMLQKSGRGTDGQWLAAEEGLGDVRAVLGEHGRALAHYERARALAASAAGSSERLAGLCRKTAMLHERKGQYAAALQWLDQGLSAVGVEQTLETSRIRLAGAGVHSRQGQHHQALEWCQLGLEIARQLNAPAELAHGTYLLGTIHGHLGHSADEIACARQSVALYEDTGDLVGQANALNNLGIACKESGDWDAAMDCFKRALELDEELGNVHDVAKVTNNLGNVLLQRGQLDGAAQAYHKSLDLWTAIDFPLGVALSLSNLGEVGVEGGEWEAALDNLKRSEQLFQQIQSQHFLPEVYRRQALAYLGLGQAAEAQRNAERSVSLAAELGMELEKALSLRVLGHVLVALGKWAQAEEPLLSSLDVLKRQDNRFGMGQTLHQLGCLYHEQSRAGDTAAADNSRAALESARTIFAELGAQRELEKVREAMT